MLQAAANNNKCPAELSWDAASKMSNMFIDEPTFAQRFEQEEQGVVPSVLHKYVDHYDNVGLVLKTNQTSVAPAASQEPKKDKWLDSAVQRMDSKKK